jgi:hypothetical protein
VSQSSKELLAIFNKIVSPKQIYLVCAALIDSYKEVDDAYRGLGFSPEAERISRGHLRNSFIIENLKKLSIDEGITVGLREENWYSTPEIVIGGEVLLSIKKNESPDEIPEPSSAREDYSRMNKQIELELGISSPEKEITVDSMKRRPYKMYGVITHKSNSDKQPEFISIVFPNSHYKEKLASSVNAMEVYNNYAEELRRNEEQRIRLQPSAVDQPKRELRFKS